jgi:signal transduction histidine kinase
MSDVPSPAIHILIVDDTPLNLSLLGRILTKRGYLVRAFTNGKDAIESALQDPPNLILLDIMMPEMDGYAVCKQLKANESTRNIPIIFLSALSETENKLQAFRMGGVDYITKPFQPDEVLARVRTHLDLQALQQQLQDANRVLERRNAELEFRNVELDTFAQTVAHDLKNPLGIILGYASMLVEFYDNMTDTDRLNSAQAIIKSSTKMLQIIDELLMMARIRSTDVELEVVDTPLIINQALERVSILAQETRAKVVLPKEWPTALGYNPWVEEVWVNLISNAMKYGGQPPYIEVGADTLNDGWVRFWVHDNGPGIPPADQQRLFIPFMRLEASKSSGHGLGLSIVRRIVEKLGGETGLESQPSKGSTFYFTLRGG